MDKDKKRKNLLAIERTFDVLRFIITVIVILSMIYLGIHFFRKGYNFVIKRNEVKDLDIEINIAPGNEYEITIPWGYSTDDIAALLKEKGFIDNVFLFSIWSKFIGYEGKYTAGVHVLDRTENYNTLDGYEKLMYILSQNPKKKPDVRVFIPEGSTWHQTEKILKDAGIPVDDDFWKKAAEHEYNYRFLEYALDDMKKEGRTNMFEGYLFPDTYIMDPEASPEVIVDKFLSNFENKFREEFYKKTEELGITVDEAIIIASLIEREAKLDNEREIISGVIYNRLRSSDPSLNYLQIDATIQYYDLESTGKVKDVLLTEDTKIDHPYNTYVHPGLPPGPICSPGLSSIIAALYPEEHDYYYYVARGDGSHEFSRTYDEHMAAVRKYQNNNR
jgi:UPF0755 protein